MKLQNVLLSLDVQASQGKRIIITLVYDFEWVTY